LQRGSRQKDRQMDRWTTVRQSVMADRLANRLADRLIGQTNVTPYKKVDNENDRQTYIKIDRHIII
jgi:hypothetical protein